MATSSTGSRTPDEDEILELLQDREGLRVEEVADEAELEFEEAREIIHDLWDQNLVVSGPDFEFEADREEPPNRD